MKHPRNLFASALLVACAAMGSSASAAVITQVAMPVGFNAAVLLNDFETTKDTAAVTFNATAQLFSAGNAAGGVTPSGTQGLVETINNEPLGASLATPSFEVGLWFGNDDFNSIFDAILEVFDGLTSLGSVSLLSNGNDFADQFIGLRSDTAFDRVEFRFQRPEAGGLAIYIDDFYAGTQGGNVVPEPGSLALAGLMLAGMVAFRRRMKR